MHFVRTFSIMRAYGVRLSAIEEARNYGKVVFIKNIFQNGWWEDMQLCIPLILPPAGPALGHKLQKTLKKSGIFQSLGTINFVIFH